MPVSTLFIGSSRESLPLAEVLADKLKDCAEVTLWNDVFEGHKSTLDNLLSFPERFDFGLFIFGPDDRVSSRNIEQRAPRDNVIFELGLFMQELGIERTFVVVLPDVKILSDFGGWNFIKYKEPSGWEEFRKELEEKNKNVKLRQAVLDGYKKELEPFVASAVTTIAALIKKMGVNQNVAVLPVAPGVHTIWKYLEELISQARRDSASESALVKHLALDMGDAWDLLRDGIVKDENVRDVTWRCLMTDPESVTMHEAKAWSSSVDQQKARSAIAAIQDTLSDKILAGQLSIRKLAMEVRAYREIPVMHGFLVQDQALLWSMCDISPEGKLEATRTPYFRFKLGERAYSSHVVNSFEHWFDYHWKTAGRIWPPD